MHFFFDLFRKIVNSWKKHFNKGRMRNRKIKETRKLMMMRMKDNENWRGLVARTRQTDVLKIFPKLAFLSRNYFPSAVDVHFASALPSLMRSLLFPRSLFFPQIVLTGKLMKDGCLKVEIKHSQSTNEEMLKRFRPLDNLLQEKESVPLSPLFT